MVSLDNPAPAASTSSAARQQPPHAGANLLNFVRSADVEQFEPETRKRPSPPTTLFGTVDPAVRRLVDCDDKLKQAWKDVQKERERILQYGVALMQLHKSKSSLANIKEEERRSSKNNARTTNTNELECQVSTLQTDMRRLQFAAGGRIQRHRRIIKMRELLERADELVNNCDDDASVMLPERKRIFDVGGPN